MGEREVGGGKEGSGNHAGSGRPSSTILHHLYQHQQHRQHQQHQQYHGDRSGKHKQSMHPAYCIVHRASDSKTTLHVLRQNLLGEAELEKQESVEKEAESPGAIAYLLSLSSRTSATLKADEWLE